MKLKSFVVVVVGVEQENVVCVCSTEVGENIN
jgi:hypothetical protein